MPLYGGMARYANTRVVVWLNEHDQVMNQQRFAHHCPTLLERLAASYSASKGMVAEFPSSWYWLVDGLREAGSPVHLANPAARQQYGGLQSTNDHADACWLAHMFRRGVWPDGTIYPKAERAGRDVLRKIQGHCGLYHCGQLLQRVTARGVRTSQCEMVRSMRKGHGHYVTGMVRDLTAQKQLQETTRQQEWQLIQANKMTALGTLVSGVAHEINSPTQVVLALPGPS